MKKVALFLSTYINKIDKKGRVSVPSLFRQTLASDSFSGLVIYRSFKYAAIEGCSLARMEQLCQSVDQFDQFSDTYDEVAATIFADAHQLSFDNEGRIMLPDVLRHYANLTTHAAFVGRGASFQIWSPEAFETFQQEARQKVVANKTTFKLQPSTLSDPS